MSVSWNNYKWVVLGDSLTDIRPGSSEQASAPNKYEVLLNNAEYLGIQTVVEAKGGTGYWRQNGANSRFWERTASMTPDTSVDVVTIFGSVNDGKVWKGTDKVHEENYELPNLGLKSSDGQMLTWAELHTNIGNNVHPTRQQILDLLSFEDDQTNNSWVGYVNACINQARAKFPNAKIILVNELWFHNVHDFTLTEERTVKEAIVVARRAKGDTWLSIVNAYSYAYGGSDDAYASYRSPTLGLNMQLATTGSAFAAEFTYDNGGHPNDLYHRVWLAPVFANILCEALGENPENLPATLKMTQTEREDLYALWVGKPDTPTPPPTPTVIAYDINGSPMTEAYDINGELLTSLYDINGEVLVQ